MDLRAEVSRLERLQDLKISMPSMPAAVFEGSRIRVRSAGRSPRVGEDRARLTSSSLRSTAAMIARVAGDIGPVGTPMHRRRGGPRAVLERCGAPHDERHDEDPQHYPPVHSHASRRRALTSPEISDHAGAAPAATRSDTAERMGNTTESRRRPHCCAVTQFRRRRITSGGCNEARNLSLGSAST
jgi:hypothetical protein